MKSGRLRDRITIQTYTDSLNSYGELVKTWATFATVFAEITPISGREYLQSEQVRGEISHRIRIRYLAGILDKMQIVHGSRTFQIVAVLPDRTNAREIIIMANERKV